MSSSSSLEKFLFGSLLGAAVGALLGLLLAPRSGDETRRVLQQETEARYKKGVGKAAEGYDKSVDVIRDKYQQSVDTLKDASLTFKNWAEELSGELEQLGRVTLSKLKGDEEAKSNGTADHPEVLNAEVATSNEEEPAKN
jgi:gas vesicle protein